MQNDEFLEETREIPQVKQEVEFVFNFFKCGLRVEIIEAKTTVMHLQNCAREDILLDS